MTIFETLAKTFGPKAKAPTVEALERAEREAEAAVTAARAALEALEGERVTAVVQGDAARTTFRAKLTTSRDDLEDAEAALAAVRDRLAAARQEAAEKGRREQYERVKAQQIAVADALAAKYQAAVDELMALKAMVAEADAQVVAVNASLPAGAEPLPREVEGIARDIPGQPRSVVSSEMVELWVGEGGSPIADQNAVKSRDGRTGHITVQTGFGSHALPVRRETFEKRVVRPWVAPVYGARLRDLELPDLRPEGPPPPGEVEELVPVTEAAQAAE